MIFDSKLACRFSMYLTPAGSEITEQINVLFSTGTSDANYFSYFRTRSQPCSCFQNVFRWSKSNHALKSIMTRPSQNWVIPRKENFHHQMLHSRTRQRISFGSNEIIIGKCLEGFAIDFVGSMHVNGYSE